MTGSGKTGLGIGLIEEAAIDGIPVIAIDPKGDLGNLLLTFPRLAAGGFLAVGRCRRSASSRADTGGVCRRRSGEVVEGPCRVGRRTAPASSGCARPPSSRLYAGQHRRPAAVDRQVLRRAGSGNRQRRRPAAGSRQPRRPRACLTLAGVDAEPMRSREHTLIATLFGDSWRAGRDLDLPALITQIQTPPITKIGVVDLESFFPSKDRFALAMQLNQLLAAPGFGAWLEGEPLDVDRLLLRRERPAASQRDLDRAPRRSGAHVLRRRCCSTRSSAGCAASAAPRACARSIYFDEIFGFLPPVANPPSKRPLLTHPEAGARVRPGPGRGHAESGRSRLQGAGQRRHVDARPAADRSRQGARAGRTRRSRDRAAPLDRSRIDHLLSGLGKRQFLLHNVHEKEPVVFETRWTLSYLRGPLGRDEFKRLASVPKVPRFQRFQRVRFQQVPLAPGPNGYPASRCLIRRYSSSLCPARRAYAPMLLGVARVSYSDAKLGLDDTRNGHGRDADHRRRGRGRLGSRRDCRLHGRLPAEGAAGRRDVRGRPGACARRRRTTPPGRRTSRSGLAQSQSIELFKSIAREGGLVAR